jgi:hypothetical protein
MRVMRREVLVAGAALVAAGSAGWAHTSVLQAPRGLECPPEGVLEIEPCGDDTNGGCGSNPAQFEPIELGTIVCGTVWLEESARDTDWYEIVLAPEDVPVDLKFSATAEFVCQFGLVAYLQGHEGSGDCYYMNGLGPWALADAYETESIEFTIDTPGIYWLFIAPDLGDGSNVIECGEGEDEENDYICLLEEVFPLGDITGPGDVPDGIVNVLDLLALLGDWGCEGAPGECLGDISGPDGEPDGVTNTSDLLALLGNWG